MYLPVYFWGADSADALLTYTLNQRPFAGVDISFSFRTIAYLSLHEWAVDRWADSADALLTYTLHQRPFAGVDISFSFRAIAYLSLHEWAVDRWAVVCVTVITVIKRRTCRLHGRRYCILPYRWQLTRKKNKEAYNCMNILINSFIIFEVLCTLANYVGK